jgi:hypothetical protein
LQVGHLPKVEKQLSEVRAVPDRWLQKNDSIVRIHRNTKMGRAAVELRE